MTSAFATSILRNALCHDSQSNKQNHHLMKRRKCIYTVAAFLLFLGLFAPQAAWGDSSQRAFSFENNGNTFYTDHLTVAVYYADHNSTITVHNNTGYLSGSNPYYYTVSSGGNANPTSVANGIIGNKSITIQSSGSATYTVTRNYAYYCIYFNNSSSASLTINRVDFNGGNVTSNYPFIGFDQNSGSGNKTITINDCTFRNCKRSGNILYGNGGAIAVSLEGLSCKGKLICNNVEFYDNTYSNRHESYVQKTYGGGAISVMNGVECDLNDCEFYDNWAVEGGGAIYFGFVGDCTIDNCIIGKEGHPNQCLAIGGGIYCVVQENKTLTIKGNTSIQYNNVTTTLPGYSGTSINSHGYGGGIIIGNESQGHVEIGEAGKTVTISNNYARGGGGGFAFWCGTHGDASLSMHDFLMENNRSGNVSTGGTGGGAVAVHGIKGESSHHTHSCITIQDGVVRNNHSDEVGGGGFLFGDHGAEVINVSFENNYTEGTKSYGGAVAVYAADGYGDYSLELIRCTFTGNGILSGTTKTKCGGAIYAMDKAEVRVLGCTIGGSAANANKAIIDGGGIYIGSNAYLTMDSRVSTSPVSYNTMEVSYNEAGNDGGGIYVANGSQGHTNIGSNSNSSNKVQIHHNTAGSGSNNGMGGGIYLECGGYTADQFTLTNFELSNNTASLSGKGGGAYIKGHSVSGQTHNHGNMTISSGTVSGNSAFHGGGIYFDHHDADINSVTFNGHSVSGNGGAVYIEGHSNDNDDPHQHDFTSCTFTSNSAMNGGAVYVYDHAEALFDGTSIGDGTLANKNSAATNGGGVYFGDNSLGRFENSTSVNYNTATNGGGIYIANSCEVLMDVSLVTNNIASTDGGGIWVGDAPTGTICDFLLEVKGVGSGSDGRLTYYLEKYEGGTWTRCRDVDGRESFVDAVEYLFLLPSSKTYRIKMGATTSGCYTYYKGYYEYNGTEYETGNIYYTAGTTSSNIAIPLLNNTLTALEVRNSTISNNTATSGNGGGVYLTTKATADFHGLASNTMKIQNNTAGNFGGGVYIGTDAVMGVRGDVKVNTNRSTRATNVNYSEPTTGGHKDDACLQTLSDSYSVGKIKVLGDLEGSNIGITEQQVASGYHRDLDLSGNRMRQFTVNYGDHGSEGASKPFDKNVFFSNDTILPVILLLASSPTTTGKIELTLGKPVARGWYVAGIVDDKNATWGNDNNSGQYPDVPKRTLTGTNGVFAAGYDPDNDHIFVVRAISAYQEALVRQTEGKAIIRYPNKASTSNFTDPSYTIPDATGSKEVVLHRYPGGHRLSNGNYDLTIFDGGPMANTGPVFSMDGMYETKLYNIHMDGLSDYSKEDGMTNEDIDAIDPEHTHNPSYLKISPNSALLSVEEKSFYPSYPTVTISLNEHCEIEDNNNKNGTDNSGNTSPTYENKEKRTGGGVYCAGTLVCNDATIKVNQCATTGGGIHIASTGSVTLNNSVVGGDDPLTKDGDVDFNSATTAGGGVYKLGTLKVQGETYVFDNKSGSAKAQVLDNVYIPEGGANGAAILIPNALACGSRIGVTKTKSDHTYESDMNAAKVGEEVRTVIATNETASSGHALDAYRKEVFFDDTDTYGVWSFNYGTGGTAYSIENCYFIETWRSFADPNDLYIPMFGGSSYDFMVSSAEGLAYLAKLVNSGENSHLGYSVYQVADIDLGAHYWEPIGKERIIAGCNAVVDAPYAGNYSGQGHLVKNMISILPVKSMGLFGATGKYNSGTESYDGVYAIIENTFVINHDLTLTGDGQYLGGLVGHRKNTLVNRCEATGNLTASNQINTDLSSDKYPHIGGIIGGELDGGESSTLLLELRNSFAISQIRNIKASGRTSCSGGLIGQASGHIYNCYAKPTIEATGSAGTAHSGALFGQLGSAAIAITAAVKNCYVVSSNLSTLGTNTNGTITNVYTPETYTNATHTYTATIGADQLGYMYADNLVSGTTTPLFEQLTTNAEALNTTEGQYLYDLWARPALAYYVEDGSKAVTIERPINGDLPVLLMDNKATKFGIEGGGVGSYALGSGSGDFRSVSTISDGAYGTIADGYALQYSGPLRDYGFYENVVPSDPINYSDSPINGMLDRSDANESHFIYGDVEAASTVAMTAAKANRISIYEHAAITRAGTLGSFNKTHVSITFDNSRAESGNPLPLSTEGVNGFESQPLPRDWHIFSTPLRFAPLGFNYKTSDGTETNINNLAYSNNPWSGGGSATTPGGTEFDWLGGGNNRYWMTGWTGSQTVTSGGYVSSAKLSDWTDGYFPSTFCTAAPISHIFGQGCIEGAQEYGKYPYGMDLYAWYEPEYHYINFKRNGPNHWHSDEPHGHLEYHYDNNKSNDDSKNLNETNLVSGKGYMASIAKKTLLQSSGALNGSRGSSTDPMDYKAGFVNMQAKAEGEAKGRTDEVRILATKNTNDFHICEGWNLVGNPFHAYLDFDAFCEGNSDKISDNTYLVYNADGDNGNGFRDNGSGFSYYVKNGSSKGAYASRYLHPHQGFFVKVGSTTELTFSESQTKPRSEIGTSGGYREDNRPAYPLVNLFLTSEKGCSDVCVVEFNRPEWGGGGKLREIYSGNGLFYAYHDDKNYAALFATPEAERIPIKFEAKEPGGDTYTITWNTANGDFSKLYLVDNMTGVQYDMLAHDSYSFRGQKGDYWSRFYIVFDVTGVEEEQDEDQPVATTFAFYDGAQWVVTNDGSGSAILQLIDLQGRVLETATLANGQTRVSLPNVATGMYLLRMSTVKGTQVQKIIVR